MSCPHLRRFYYRQRLRVENKRPKIPLVERCVECGHLFRDDVPVAEVNDAVLSPQFLAMDPWEGR